MAFQFSQFGGILLLATDLLRGGIIGVATGVVFNKVLPQYRQAMPVNAVLGAVGYWAGVYIWATKYSAMTGNRNVGNLWMVAAVAGSIVVVAIGDISISRIRRLLNKQANPSE